jgi:hypothetical protein
MFDFFKKIFGIKRGEKESWRPTSDIKISKGKYVHILSPRQKKMRRLAEISKQSRLNNDRMY